MTHSNENRNSCQICGEQFKQKQLLERHKNKHVEEERPYSCANPYAKRKKANEYQDHEDGNSRVGSSLCGVCGESFGSVVRLNTHKLTHFKGKNYSCSACGSQFPLSEQLQNGCPICKGRSVSLDVYKEGEKRDVEEWPSFYEIHGIGFETIEELNTHKLTPSERMDYCSEICGVAVQTIEDLNTHKPTHSERMTFSCTICAEVFESPEILNTHRLSHEEEISQT